VKRHNSIHGYFNYRRPRATLNYLSVGDFHPIPLFELPKTSFEPQPVSNHNCGNHDCACYPSLKPEDARLHQELGIALGRIGDPYAAVRELREAIRIDPADELARSRFIRALISDDDVHSAVEETRTLAKLLGRAKSTLPTDFLNRVAVWMIKAGENDSALAVCEIFETATIGSGDGHRCLEIALRESERGDDGASPKSDHLLN
jgi:hypothetical protein